MKKLIPILLLLFSLPVYAQVVDKKVTDLNTIPSIAPADVVYIVDVSDTTDDPAGSSFKVPFSVIEAAISYANIGGTPTLGTAADNDEDDFAPSDAEIILGTADAALPNGVVIDDLGSLNTHLNTTIADGPHTVNTDSQNASQVPFTPQANISSSTTQNAVVESYNDAVSYVDNNYQPSLTDGSTTGDMLEWDGDSWEPVAIVDLPDPSGATDGEALVVSSGAYTIDALTFTDSMCWYIEDPVDTDDLESIYANKTSVDFTLTEIWGESDQTVNFDLQVDDGTPADVNGTDISPAAGEAEDTTLSGDTTLGAGEEIDLIITSVSGTPTWVSICLTFTRGL